jgi:hypothetical protein
MVLLTGYRRLLVPFSLAFLVLYFGLSSTSRRIPSGYLLIVVRPAVSGNWPRFLPLFLGSPDDSRSQMRQGQVAAFFGVATKESPVSATSF